MKDVLQLAKEYASFDGETNESDFVISGQFPEGFLIAEENSSIIGFVFAHFIDVPSSVLSSWGVTKVGEISLLAVDEKHRKKGVGTALVQRVLKELKSSGVDMILLNCPAEATDARRLYDRIRFENKAYHMKMKF
jgi:ribosomal protein S18 acetylase RimI-like enzyme